MLKSYRQIKSNLALVAGPALNNVYRGLEFFRPIRGIREKGKPAQLFIYQSSTG